MHQPIPTKKTTKKPGRPIGAKNVTMHVSQVSISQEEKRAPGRPRGARNKKGVKVKTPSQVDYADRYSDVSGAPPGSRTVLDLMDILEHSVQTYWTDERVMDFFGSHSTRDPEELENKCHFYASSKGRLISEHNSLSECELFPNVALSAHYLDQFIHTFDDVATYGEFVRDTRAYLQRRAQALEET